MILINSEIAGPKFTEYFEIGLAISHTVSECHGDK